ncbi:hypothetical protein UPYG_G00096540 [Umbra pygmaea]|uniref:Fibronectin type-III domain-containing protein n=1 Tax=Umbra pygmaea TaxID=75934 RepID=A0ABD0X4D8_UMBPY
MFLNVQDSSCHWRVMRRLQVTRGEKRIHAGTDMLDEHSRGNMHPFWVSCGSLLPLLVFCFAKEHCKFQENTSQYDESSVLESLRCYNNYHSTVHCSWVESDPNSPTPLVLYSQKKNETPVQCKPLGEPSLTANSSKRSVQCEFKTGPMRMATEHRVFFQMPCPSRQSETQRLAQMIQVHPPVNLSEQAVEGGGRLLTWSSPSPTTSLLSSTLVYQVNYRCCRQDDWTTVVVNDTQLTVEGKDQQPGCKHEARVRAKGKTGLWSEWSPVLAWLPDGSPPSLECLLDEETVVTCSWEVTRHQAVAFTFHLDCKYNQTAALKRCCGAPTVSASSGDQVLLYSCTFLVQELETLEVELIQTRNIKKFVAHKNIRPDRPIDVEIEEKNGNWLLKWNQSKPQNDFYKEKYEVRYWRKATQDYKLFCLEPGALTLSILRGSLQPSERYLGQVRACVEHEGIYEGTPSEWTDPIEWTSHPPDDSWSLTTIIYGFVAFLVILTFIALYFCIPACHKRVVLWEVSLPNPLKSKVMEEVMKKSLDGWLSTQTEKTEKITCIVQNQEAREHISSCSTCSSEDPPWSTLSVKSTRSSFSSSSTLLSMGSPVSDCSGLSFSGPYIFCSETYPAQSQSLDIQPTCEVSEGALPNSLLSFPVSSHTLSAPLLESSEDYVVMPQARVGQSRPTNNSSDGLIAVGGDNDNHNGNNNSNICLTDRPEPERLQPQPTLIHTPKSPLPNDDDDPPPEYTPPNTCHFTLPSMGPALHTSGYCSLPAQEDSGSWVNMQSSGPAEGGGVEQQAVRERRLSERSIQNPYVTLLNLPT